MKTLIPTLTAVVALGAVATPTASAWTVTEGTLAAGVMTFTAGAGEKNSPVMTRLDPVLVRFTDPGAGTAPTPSADCTTSAEFALAQCAYRNRVVVNLGDLGDVASIGAGEVGADGFRLDVNGQGGNDAISNAEQDGTLDGGSGNDVLRPGLGADVIRGGSGTLDAVDYRDRTNPVRVNFFSTADSTEQGETGEGDSIPGEDVEVALGGKGADTLIGDGSDEQFIPGPGADTVTMAQGDDIADLRDGAKDAITCGTGSDTVLADTIDTVAADCEDVTRAGGVTIGSPGGGGLPPLGLDFPVPTPPAPAPAPGDPAVPAPGEPAPGAGGAGGGPGASIDTARPRITLAHVTRRAIRRSTTRTARAAAATRTSLRFNVSEPAALTVKIGRRKAGRRSGARCVAPTRALVARGAKRCERVVTVATLRRARVEGSTSIRLSARIGNTQLGVGSYRLTLTARDAAGHTSAPARVGLRVTRR